MFKEGCANVQLDGRKVKKGKSGIRDWKKLKNIKEDAVRISY